MASAVSKLSGKTVEVTVEMVRLIISKMTGNVNFTTPNPPLADMTSESDKLETYYQNALNGGKTLKSLMRLQKKKVLEMAKSLLAYVQTTSGGDEGKILSSGFYVRGKNAPIGILSAPKNVRAALGKHPGELIVRWAGVAGRIGYKVQMSPDPVTDGSWIDLPNGETGKVRLVVGGLITGKMYWFRIYTKSTAGPSGPSDPTGHIVI